MASTSKPTRDCTRTPKCSILLSNVLGITLVPCFLDVDQDATNGSDPRKPQLPSSGKTLFDSFVQNNKSTLHTRLNESLAEIRFAGWIQPFTLLIKGPQEELDVLKEAWRRRFLRSPDQFSLREIGTIKSIDTEIIQQAPFLPLTKAVYEAISALNKNNLPSGQKQVFEYLAHTYQYVHVPRPNIIRDCLGILFKEGKVYASENNEYFVLVDSASEKTDPERKEPESTTSREKPKEKTQVYCSWCEEEKPYSPAHVRDKRSSRYMEHAQLCEQHKRLLKSGRKSSSSKESFSRDTSKEGKERDTSKESKEQKSEKKEKKYEENSNKKQKEKGNKKTVWGQIAGFMKGKTSHDSSSNNKSKSVAAEKKDADVKVIDTVSSGNPESIVSVDGTPKQNVTKEDDKLSVSDVSSNERKPVEVLQRSRSFTGSNKNRPDLTRSNSYTKNANKPKAVDYDTVYTRQTSEPTKTSVNVEKGHPSPRDLKKPLDTEETLQKSIDQSGQRNNNTCAVGVVRPWNTHIQNSLTESRSISRSSSTKDSRKMTVLSSSAPTSELPRSARDSKMVTSPGADFQRPISRDSKNATPTIDFERSLYGDSKMSTPTGPTDVQRQPSRDSKMSTPTSNYQRSLYIDSKMSTPSSDSPRLASRDSTRMTTRASADFQRSISRDSKMSGSPSFNGDIQRLRDPTRKSVESSSSTLTSGVRTPTYHDSRVVKSVTPTSESQRPVLRDPRSITRSLSLRENRKSDITPLSYQRTHFNPMQRDVFSNESPLKHILTKNTGNILPVSPNHPNYIPATTIQDRTRPSSQNRNSFPNSNSWRRASWRTTPKEYPDERDLIGPTAKGLLLDEKLRKHDELFSPIQYLQQNQRVLPCDCSDAGYSENSRVLSDNTSEQKSVSSDYYQSVHTNKSSKDCASSINSTSDNGILLDEISSTCSSEIRSIMDQEKTADDQSKSPYTVAKGEVVLDSSLTFIGII